MKEVCGHCKEQIEPGERAPTQGTPMHRECALRLVVGSVGHQRRACACYGREDTSEHGLTTREDARAAASEFEANSSSAFLAGRVRGRG